MSDLWQNLKTHLARSGQAPKKGGGLPQTSVLALIGTNKDTKRDEILLMKRTMTVDSHKGQVCFPGGYQEESDQSLLHTALRETFEEIGVPAEAVEILGSLSATPTRQTIMIHPFVGKMEFPFPFLPNQSEVERLLFLPVQRLLDEGLTQRLVTIEQFRVQSIGIDVEGELVWGATARMLDELRSILLKVKR